MRVFHLIFRSRLSAAAAIAVVALIFALVFQARHLIATLGQPSIYTSNADAGEAPASDLAWQQEMMLLGLSTTTDPSAPSSTDPLSMIGPIVVGQLVGQYTGLVDSGSYTTELGTQVAESIAPYIKAAISYKTYSKDDLKIDGDTSYDRMLTYRADLRDALAPLMANSQSEFEIYGLYIETGDEAYLDELSSAAENYRSAAKNTANMTIPRDAINYHIAILNAMEQFAATLDAMASKQQDAFASVALLRTYNSAEQAMFNSFDNLGNYYGRKLP